MSNKFKSRIEVLKDHKEDKDHKYHSTRHQGKKSNNRKRKTSAQKKELKAFKKKMEKSNKIW